MIILCIYFTAILIVRKRHCNWPENKMAEPGHWHNGSAFVFCLCGCTFESEPSPTSAHACGEVTGCAPAAKRSASVAPEVNLGECIVSPPIPRPERGPMLLVL